MTDVLIKGDNLGTEIHIQRMPWDMKMAIYRPGREA